jgi:hypothetical protein
MQLVREADAPQPNMQPGQMPQMQGNPAMFSPVGPGMVQMPGQGMQHPQHMGGPQANGSEWYPLGDASA